MLQYISLLNGCHSSDGIFESLILNSSQSCKMFPEHELSFKGTKAA